MVDGNDVLACFRVMKDAHDRARAGEGPTLIECKTYRFLPTRPTTTTSPTGQREEVEETPEPRSHRTVRARTSSTQASPIESTIQAVHDEVKAQVEVGDQRPPGTPRSRSVDRDPQRLRRGRRVTEKNLVTAIRDTLHDEMAADDRIVLIGQDVGARGGVFKVSEGFMAEFGEQRVVDAPLAESGIVGVAIGMALHGLLADRRDRVRGLHPPGVRSDPFRGVAACGTERTAIGDARWSSERRAAAGSTGALYHSQSIEAFYAHIPGVKVVMPSTPADAARTAAHGDRRP